MPSKMSFFEPKTQIKTTNMENGENKNLQGRREFFKEVAKKALPILGAVTLISNPVIAKAIESESSDCKYGCTYGCYNTCNQSCLGSCKGTCQGACTITCKETCKGTCDHGCAISCRGTCSNTCLGSCVGSNY